MKGELVLITCRNLEREARAVRESEGWSDVQVHTCEAVCLSPQHAPRVADEVAAIAQAQAGTCELVGCGALRGLPGSRGVTCTRGHARMTCCFDLFVGPSLASAWMREGAFLLTPGWLARWRDYIQEWGFDQAGARQFFEESIPRLVLLDTGVDPDASKHLDAFASFVARPSHVMPVGLDYLRDHLVRRVLAWRLQHQQASSAVALGDANRMLSDYAMSYDIVGRLAGMKSKSRVIEAIFELFGMLCAPRIMVFLPLRSGKPGQARFMPQSASEEPDVLKDMAELTADHAWTPSKSGFLLRLGSEDDPVGVLKLEGIAFPQYREHYLNLGIHLAQVCSLAVSNARAYELLEGSLTQLREAMANIRTLRGIIPICAACKKIRDDKGFWNQVEAYVQQHSQAQFTHGLCPDCISKYYP